MISRISTLCGKCNRRNECFSPTRILQEPRIRWLMTRGYRLKQTEAMRKGTEMHELLQEDMKEITKTFKKSLYKGKKETYKEVFICSPKLGLRGFIDKLEIQTTRENKTLHYDITITDFKPFYSKKYIHQIFYYGLIMNQQDCYFHYRNKKDKFIPILLYPQKLNITKTIIVQIYDYHKRKVTIRIPFITNNIMIEQYNIYLMNWVKTARMEQLKPLSEVKVCKNCKKDKYEYYERFCAKIGENLIPNDKPRYFGKKNLLVKSKPKRVGI